MLKVVVPVVTVVLYLPLVFGYAPVTVVAVIAVAVAGIAAFGWGILMSYRRPAPAALAIGGWSAASIVLLAGACVLGAWATVVVADASPSTASTSVKTFAALITTAIAAVLGGLLDWKGAFSGGAIAKRCLQKRFTGWFPAQPAAPAAGVNAWQAVDAAFFRTPGERWDYTLRRALFEAVRQAVAADGVYGGSNWQDAQPPVGPSRSHPL